VELQPVVVQQLPRLRVRREEDLETPVEGEPVEVVRLHAPANLILRF
jgi:hypothetical protein